MSKYSELFKDPRWQKKRLEVLEENSFHCQSCNSDKHTLHVHHLFYKKKAPPWDYSVHDLTVLCERCHSNWHDAKRELDRTIGADVNSLVRIIGYARAVNSGEIADIKNDGEMSGFADFYRTSVAVMNYLARYNGWQIPVPIIRQADETHYNIYLKTEHVEGLGD